MKKTALIISIFILNLGHVQADAGPSAELIVKATWNTGSCDLSWEEKRSLLQVARSIAVNKQNRACGAVRSSETLSEFVRENRYSWYGSHACTGTKAVVKLKVECLEEKFLSEGENWGLGHYKSELSAIKNAEDLCQGEVVRVSDWTNTTNDRLYVTRYQSEAYFKCR